MSIEDYIGLSLVGVLMAIPHFVMWFHRASEIPRKTPAQNPTDSERRISGAAESAATPSTAPDLAHE